MALAPPRHTASVTSDHDHRPAASLRPLRGNRLVNVLDELVADQLRTDLPELATGDTVRVGGQTRHVVSYMKDFLFGPEQANTPVGVLSGGERGRLLLAQAFAQPSNLLRPRYWGMLADILRFNREAQAVARALPGRFDAIERSGRSCDEMLM